MSRSPEGSVALIERVFGRYGIPTAVERRRTLLRATALGRALLGLSRCALLEPARARAEDLLDYLRAPGRLDEPEAADRLEAEVRRRGLRTARQAAALARVELGELEVLRVAEDPGAELAAPGPAAARRPVSGARACARPGRGARRPRGRGARAGAATSSARWTLRPTGEELIELLETLELPAGRAARGRGGARRPTRSRSGPGASGPCSCAAFRRASSRSRHAPSRSCPTSCAASWRRAAGCGCARARTRSRRERYLFYTSVSRATERRDPQLPQLRRGGQPRAALAVPRRRGRAALRGLARAPAPADARRRGVGGLRGAHRVRAGPQPRARPPRRRPARCPRRSARWATRRWPTCATAEILSAGALETYADCPVRWLVDRELQPAPLEPDSDALARGSYMHAVLEQVLRRLGEPGRRPSRSRARWSSSTRCSASRRTGLPPAAARRCGRGGPGRWPPICGATWPTRRATAPRGRSAASSCGSASISNRSRTRCRPSGWATTCACAGSSTGSTRTARAGPSCATTRADRPAPSTRARAGRPTASSRWRCTCSPSGSCSGWSRWPASTSRWAAAICALAACSSGGRPPATVWLGTTAGTRTSSRSCSRRRAAGRVALAARLRAGSLEPCPSTCSRDGCRYPGICRA